MQTQLQDADGDAQRQKGDVSPAGPGRNREPVLRLGNRDWSVSENVMP